MREENLFGVAVCYFFVGLLFAIFGITRLNEGNKSIVNSLEALENYEQLEVDLFDAYPQIPRDIETSGTDTAS